MTLINDFCLLSFMKWHMFWIQQMQQPSIQHIGPTLKSWQIPFATLEDNPSTLPKPYRGIKPDEVLILTKSKEASPWVQKQQDVEEESNEHKKDKTETENDEEDK